MAIASARLNYWRLTVPIWGHVFMFSNVNMSNSTPLEGLIFSDKAIMISGRRSVILKIKTCHFGIWHRMAWPKATNPCYNECTKFTSPRSFFFSIPSSNMFDFREWITRCCNSWLWKWDIYSQKLKTHEDTCETRENQACSKQKGFMAESERHNPRGHWRRTTPPMRWWRPWHLTTVEHMAVSRHPQIIPNWSAFSSKKPLTRGTPNWRFDFFRRLPGLCISNMNLWI